ncbi:DMT family transporter [Stieleria varia]|uniref:EamA-like transporter family protein n=1 Tax=Stieleria varia TaxID=2528005 RepID=A0A5C6AZG9_9BACT|nr:DMT family transporter [Stieleria varia]TWU05038.1 EamA-like transporter family protein [Stieleria varia]
MNWIFLSLISAVLLGVYDVSKKLSVRGNAVPIVLLISVTVGAVIWLPMIVWSHGFPSSVPVESLRVDALSWAQHGLLLTKSILVGASWTFAFTALKHLPLSIGAPIRATSPLWTILIATIAMGERPTPMQWLGIAIVMAGFWRFSLVGNREGIRFTRDRWVACMVIATLLGAISSIYDKWLLQSAMIRPATVQAWFTVYLVPVMLPMAVRWYFRDRPKHPFQWRRTILWISPLLLAADFAYFTALSDPDAMIAIVSTLRRSSVVIALAFGARALREVNFRAKAVCVAMILAGVALLTIA